MCIFALCLCIILCDTRKASENLTFIVKESLILSSVCVIIVTRGPISDSHQDLLRFDKSYTFFHFLVFSSCAINTCVSFCRVVVYIV